MNEVIGLSLWNDKLSNMYMANIRNVTFVVDITCFSFCFLFLKVSDAGSEKFFSTAAVKGKNLRDVLAC